MQKKGITLVELLVVISVVGILVAALEMSFHGWMERYEVEKITKELYMDLMNARLLAVERNATYIAELDHYEYTVGEDRNQDDEIDNEEVLPGFPKKVKHKLEWNLVSSHKVYFNTRGLMTPYRTISVISEGDADFDCMKIFKTRIITGKYDDDECVAR